MYRRKILSLLAILALATVVPASDIAVATPPEQASAAAPVPVLPDGKATDSSRHDPVSLTLGDPTTSEAETRREMEDLAASLPKGEALYKLWRDRKYVVVNDPARYDEKTGESAEPVPVDFDECADTAGDNAFWFRDRFNLCMTQGVQAKQMAVVNGVPQQIGTAYFKATVIATTTPGSHEIRFGLRMRFDRQVGEIDPAGVMGFRLGCQNADAARTSTCRAHADDPQLSIGYPIADWKLGLPGPFWFTVATTTTAVPTSDKYAAELRGYFSYLFTVWGRSAGLPEDTANLRYELFRCDSATYILSSSRCVFHHVISSLQMSASHDTMGESATFIRDAQNGGPIIAPANPGKKVPGRYLESELHRLYSGYDTSKSIKASRRKVHRTCVNYFGSNFAKGPNGRTMQCDEYPFAATYENSARVNPASVWDYAVRPVEESHNGSAGGRYSAWLREDRILDGDPFYVIITP
ncbi:NucA/NucB deoxyribonuclease domain-containing protein [Saccharothrix hoggarensis]|uniref:Deoxyribonuclease NucA/NucB domain-containing protein n=1 Tax=Saccharothrix hoggarensis TaxID=913853 RepID=A0ABW3QHL3_9PSEU